MFYSAARVTISHLGETSRRSAHHFKNGNLHHALIEIGGLIFYHLDCHDFVGLHVLAFHHLPKGALAEDIKNEVPECCQDNGFVG